MNYEEVKERLLANPKVRDAYENPPLPLVVAQRVVERRKELGMTQGQLAETLGTSQAQVWRIESGHFNPTAKTITRLERALDISFGDLYRGLPRDSRLSPQAQLEEWRKVGVLVMSDEDFAHAIELEETEEGHLYKLVRAIEGIKFADQEDVRVTVKMENSDKMELSAVI